MEIFELHKHLFITHFFTLSTPGGLLYCADSVFFFSKNLNITYWQSFLFLLFFYYFLELAKSFLLLFDLSSLRLFESSNPLCAFYNAIFSQSNSSDIKNIAQTLWKYHVSFRQAPKFHIT